MNRLSVRSRLVLLVSLVLLPVVALHAWTILARIHDREENQLHANAELVETARVAVETFLDGQFSLNQTMADAVVDNAMSLEEINRVVAARSMNTPNIHTVSWLTPDGRVLASTRPALGGLDATDRDGLRRLMAGEDRIVSGVMSGRTTGRNIFAVANAVRRNGQLVGMLVTSFEARTLGEVLDLSWDRTVRIGVVDSQGTIIYLQGVSEESLTRDRRVVAKNEPSPAALALATGKPASTRHYVAVADGQARMGAATFVQPAGWVVTATTQIQEVVGPARARAMVELGILALVSGMGLVVAWLMAACIARRAKALEQAALAYADGDRTARAGLRGEDELAAAAAMFDQMAEEVAQTEAALRQKTEELTLVLESTSDCVILMDDQWRLTYVNASAERMLQRSRELLRGRNLWEDFSELVDFEFKRRSYAAVAQGMDAHFEMFYHPGGGWYDVQLYPSKRGLTVFYRDITARKEAEASLRLHSALLDRQRQILELIATGASLPAILGHVESLVQEQHPRCYTTVLLPVQYVSGRHGYPETIAQSATLPDGRAVAGGWSVPVRGLTGEPVCALLVRCSQPGDASHDELALTQSAASLARIAIESHQREAAPAHKLQTLMAHMSEGVIAVDAGQNLILINQAALRLLRPGQPPDVAGLELTDLPPDLQAALEEAGLWGGGSMRVRLRVGATELEAQVSPVSTELGRYGTVAVLQDVTVQEQFRRMQQSFVANVSHELRGPLASMSATLEAMADGLIPEDQRSRYTKALLHEMARLRRLSYEVVDLTRMDSGVMQLQPQEIELADLFQQVLISFERRAASANLTLEAEPTELWAFGDFDRVGQVITNLLDNALRFTPEGGVIRLSATREGSMVRINVADTGMGIPAEHLAHIWERFYKVDAARTLSPASGTGLGLAIVRQLVHLMDGEVSVKSAVGQGTVFSFTLPVVS